MGRIFEKRKHKMFARYDKMAKAFTRIGREIAMSVKQSGPDPNNNPRLRLAIQNAKAVNMPKDRVENAIKRASSKEEKDFEEIVYEGYAPHGIALVIEAATDNPTRTVANVRMHFSKHNGSLGKNGSVDYLFERKSIFKIDKPENNNIEELELQLIDFGAEDFNVEDDGIYIYAAFSDFGNIQKGLEDIGIEVVSAEKERIPTNVVELNEEQQKEVEELIEDLEAEDDIQTVFHNMK